MPSKNVVGVILAGGQSRRMGGQDKALLSYQGLSLIEHVALNAQKQVDHLLITHNREDSKLPELGLTVLTDTFGCFDGPLAGVLTGFDWLRSQNPRAQWLATFPADATQFADNWVSHCIANARANHLPLTYVSTSKGPQYTFAVYATSLVEELGSSYQNGNRSLKRLFAHYPPEAALTFPAADFNNINTPEEWKAFQEKQNK